LGLSILEEYSRLIVKFYSAATHHSRYIQISSSEAVSFARQYFLSHFPLVSLTLIANIQMKKPYYFSCL
jgi:hypothetical protein